MWSNCVVTNTKQLIGSNQLMTNDPFLPFANFKISMAQIFVDLAASKPFLHPICWILVLKFCSFFNPLHQPRRRNSTTRQPAHYIRSKMKKQAQRILRDRLKTTKIKRFDAKFANFDAIFAILA
jgi:hypothetical protein